MDIFETISKRYSCRAYRPKPIEQEKLAANRKKDRQKGQSRKRRPESNRHSAIMSDAAGMDQIRTGRMTLPMTYILLFRKRR